MDLLEKVISLCKRRGFVFPSSQIYGGFKSTFDFGSLGIEMKNNIKKIWWEEMTLNHENIVGIDSSILTPEKIWQASGHLEAGFSEKLVECKKCHLRFPYEKRYKSCPHCKGSLTKPQLFNLMLKTNVGPVADKSSEAYLRPETCQGIFVNFQNILRSSRLKIPFGVVQIGKAFRNEITTKNFIFKTREFEQMEMEWFFLPKTKIDWFEYWKSERLKWYLNLGINKENLRLKEVPKEKRAHYAKRQVDIEYKFPFGWEEIEGIHNRGDFDLKRHQSFSHQDLSYFDEKSDKKILPHIIETSAGVERLMLAFLCDAYCEIKGGRKGKTKKEAEILLKLDKRLAPIKVAVFPLLRNKRELVEKAKKVYQILKPLFQVQYDEVGSIGRRYRRQDEIGTCFCLTIDFQTLEDNTVTIRDRDTMEQKRIEIEKLKDTLFDLLNPKGN